ncbi:uncharacterized protein [Ptychodera flava]|uniref:uncharacterized protein n=1 Tax=Ptychodera flava TaxID=63121 RepID=UPI00396A8A08
MDADAVSPIADVQQTTDTSSSVGLKMHQKTAAPNDESKLEMGKIEFGIWFVLFVLLIIIGSLLLIINIVIATYCLHDQEYTTAICSVRWRSLRKYRKIAETIEPIVSTLIVVLAMVLTYKSRMNRNVCRACRLISEELFPTLKDLRNKYWFDIYAAMVILSFAYHIYVFVINLKKDSEGSFRYLSLPLGVTSWFVWLVALNESGAMITVLKKTYKEDQVSRLYRLYRALLIYAAITNFIEFLIYTIYLTGNLTTIVASLKLQTYIEFIGMTLTVALRYSLASFFFQMFYVGEKKYKLLNDPWTEEKP